MAEVLSIGVIAVLCTVVITTSVLIILYCICRSKDPLHDHTCVAWLHSPRTIRNKQHKYDELPLYDMQNERKAPRQDKHRTVQRLRMDEKKEKAKVVDVQRNELYERNPEKCPLSIDEPDFHIREPSGRRETVSREKERRDRSHENQSRSKEYWEPKTKSMHDIHVNEEYYLQSHSQEYRINKQSRSLNFIDKYDELDGSALYKHPRPHYVYPRSIERNQEGSNHSYSHSLLPRTLEREGRRGRIEERQRHSSSHYMRPRSMESERKGRSHSSHVRPRSVERGVKDNHEHNPKPFEDMNDSPYVNLSPPAAKRDTRHQDKHRVRSKDNIHANENYYQNVSHGNHENFAKKSRGKVPLLQASEEIAVSDVQQLSAEIPPRKESERQRDRDGQHHTRYEHEYRDGERMPNGRKPQSRPRARSTEYRRTRSSHELNGIGWSDHTKGGKESYFLPRTQSMISARPSRDDDSTIGRRHTIHLEFHPRSGDVTPVDGEKESDLKKNREYLPRKPSEFSPKRSIGQHDASNAQQHNHESHARDTNQRQNTDEKSQTEPGKEKHELAIPTRYDSHSAEHRGADQRPRPRSEDREEFFMIPPRYDSLPDHYRRAEHKTRHPKAGTPTLDKHHALGPRKSTESTSSRATMESIHREIQSSSIYKTTDDGRLVLRDTIKDTSEDKGTQRTRTSGMIPAGGPREETRTERARSPENKPINRPGEDKGTQRTRKDTREPDGAKGTQRQRSLERIPLMEPSGETQKARIREEKPHKLSEETERQKIKNQEKKSLKQPSEVTESAKYTVTQRTRVTEEKSPQGTREDTREPTARVPPKRTKSIERVFYVKSVPRAEPTINNEEPPEVSTDENVDWNLLRLTGGKADDASEDERSIQNTSASALPSKVLSDKNIDWHLFTLPGQIHKPLTVNDHCEEDVLKKASHGQTKPASPKMLIITGKRIEKKNPTQDKAQRPTTSTKEWIRQSLATQIKYGEELHTPSENSLPRKPIILHFE